jgi:hypothetical protein
MYGQGSGGWIGWVTKTCVRECRKNQGYGLVGVDGVGTYEFGTVYREDPAVELVGSKHERGKRFDGGSFPATGRAEHPQREHAGFLHFVRDGSQSGLYLDNQCPPCAREGRTLLCADGGWVNH